MRFNPKSTGRWKWLFIIGIPIVTLGVIGKVTNTDPPTNSAQTTPDAAPELRTRVYSQSVETVNQKAREVATAQTTWLRSWRVAPPGEITSGTPHHDFQVEVPVLFFTDDLTVHLDTTDDGETRVNVESKSRVGQGDFGENRRHIAQFLRALDQALNNSA